MKTTLTIHQLADLLGKSVWEKGELSRIYMNNVGYNTKKMSTKAFMFIKDGEIIFSATVECPSQDEGWIMSQEETRSGSTSSTCGWGRTSGSWKAKAFPS